MRSTTYTACLSTATAYYSGLCCILLLVLLAASVCRAQPQSAAPADEPVSRFLRTVHLLQLTPPDTQSDFARTALAQLAEVYMAEADLARHQASSKPGRSKLIGWSRAVDRYANRLLLSMEDIKQGSPATLSRNSMGIVSVSVADRMVILSHPRVDQQAAYEQRVLREFCTRHDCQALTVTLQAQEPIPLSSSLIEPQWTFTETGMVCSHDGIALVFGDVSDLAASRSLCGQLLQEGSALAIEIAWQQRHGVDIDWRVLKILPIPGSTQHRVHLNFAGDSILETLPLLNGSPGLLRDIEPWLKTRFADGPRTSVRLQAARYGWERTNE